MNEELKYPYVVFKIEGSYYCLNSKYIATIVQLPHFDKVPAAPANVTGMFRYRDQVIQMLDLRITFGLKPMKEEMDDFEKMIDARKQDHINWVNEFERCVKTEEPFRLGKDPHQCALGRWYDHFTTDNSEVLFHLKKIEEPHRQLHHAAHEVDACTQECDSCRRSECLKNVLSRVMEDNMPTILKLLDETKDLFRSSFYKEMVLLLDGTKWGIVVDEIVGVEELNIIEQGDNKRVVSQQSYILNVLESPKREDLIFELNAQSLFELLEDMEQKIG